MCVKGITLSEFEGMGLTKRFLRITKNMSM